MAFFSHSNLHMQTSPNLNSGYFVINGRRVPIDNGIHGRDLAATGSGRRTVKISCDHTQLVDPDKFYLPVELLGKHGKPVKISSIPDRTKGTELFAGNRDHYSRTLLLEQIEDVTINFARNPRLINFDADNADWLVFTEFRMPPAWNVSTAPLMIIFPREYPTMPPIGFYLPNDLQSPNGHFYGRAYHGAEQAPTVKGWNWYCCFVNPGAWQPYPARRPGEWKYGDNLWTYITLIGEVLGSPLTAS